VSGLPSGWVSATLQDLAAVEPRSITDGPFGSNLKTAHYTNAGPRVIRLQNIGDGVFLDEQAHISQEHFNALLSHSVRPNDLLIAGMGETLPRACLAPKELGDAIVKADCFRVRLHPTIQPGYVCAVLNSPLVRSAASKRISGVGRPRLNLKKLREVRVPVPPAAEQKRIVAAVEEQFSRMDVGVVALERVIGALTNTQAGRVGRLRSAILSTAVSGKLVPQDPSDEPASVLLERIAQERLSSRGHKPTKARRQRRRKATA
jgi:type I restriction enzyme S subunit